MTSNHDLSNRTILITGASSGFGAHFARLYAGQGANVVLGARRTDRIEALTAELGPNALAVPMDVQDQASVIAAFDAAEAHFGSIDSVVANAGISWEGRLIDMPADDFDAVFSVNTRGVFLTAQEAAKRMIAKGSKEREHGRILIIASITAGLVTPGLSAYSASKAGVDHLGRHMAREWARLGISVNMIHPGYFATEINDDWFACEGGAKQVAAFARKRLPDISDMDALASLLVSDAAGGITGSSFKIDDGQSLVCC